MISERELNLIIDLAKLVKKYGPDSFDELSEIFLSEEKTRKLTDLLKNVSNIAKQSKSSSKGRTSSSVKISNVKSFWCKEKRKYSKAQSREIRIL